MSNLLNNLNILMEPLCKDNNDAVGVPFIGKAVATIFEGIIHSGYKHDNVAKLLGMTWSRRELQILANVMMSDFEALSTTVFMFRNRKEKDIIFWNSAFIFQVQVGGKPVIHPLTSQLYDADKYFREKEGVFPTSPANVDVILEGPPSFIGPTPANNE